jgi:hypothetical protein
MLQTSDGVKQCQNCSLEEAENCSLEEAENCSLGEAEMSKPFIVASWEECVRILGLRFRGSREDSKSFSGASWQKCRQDPWPVNETPGNKF